MVEGFYSALFQTPMGMGGGVAHLSGGKVHGGDSTMFYIGTYVVDGDTMSAKVKINTHLKLPGHMSVFGVPSADLTFTGKVGDGKVINATATAAQAPGIRMNLTLTRLSG
jgi:hypothetical protein